MESVLDDVKYAVRGLVKSPGFASLTIICLMLGIGINSAVFSIADSVAWRPLPFSEPDRLVALYATQPSNAVDRSGVSYQEFRDWTEQARAFSEVAAHSYRNFSMTEGVESERFFGSAVTWNLFPLLGVSPALGRQFTADDDRAGAAPVVILSDGVWQRRFRGDPAIIGRAVTVDGAAHTVIGVMPPRFQFPQIAQLWVPVVPLEHASDRHARTLNPYARLSPGTTVDAAGRDLAAVADRVARTHRENDGWSARVATIRDDLMPWQLQVASFAMIGAVSLVLLVACANVANLLLARATARQREMAVRASLGAGRWRLVRQLMAESLLLGLLSAPFGVLVGYLGLDAITSAIPATVIYPYYVDWTMNSRVIIYTAVTSVLTALVFGLAPARQAAGTDLFGALKDGGRGAGGSRARNRLRNTLVVVEVALSIVLLVGASLFVRSFMNLQGADGGIDTSRLMTMRVFMSGEAYATPEAMTARVDDIVQRVEALPGVTAAFASSYVPLSGGNGNAGIVPEGVTVESGKEPRIGYFATTPHALATLGQTLVAGRDLTASEAVTRSGVAIVNQAFVERFWPGRSDVVGRRFRFSAENPDQWLTIIGMVSDFQPLTLRDKSTVEPLAILPYPYRATQDTGLTIRVAGGDPASITAAARQAIGQSDPSLALFNVRTGDENREGRAFGPGFLSWMFAIFGAVALFLAGIGIYGVLSYSVAQRTQEFGVRVALGASRRSVFGLVLSQGARLAGIGIAIGVVGAFLITRVVQALLYNVTATDPLSFVGTAAGLAAVTILAGCVPAARAIGVDPIVALRAD